MAHLSDMQLASLLDEIAAAMRIGAPVGDAVRRLGDRRLGSVARAARKFADAIDRGEAASEAIKLYGSPLITQASATIQACEKSNDSTLLSQVATQLRARYEHSRLTRLTWLYPIFLLALAYAVAVLAMVPVVLGNQSRDFKWSDGVVRICNYLSHSWPIPLAIGIALIVLFLVWASRRQALPKHVQRFIFCQSLADQLEHRIPEREAIRSAALMSGQSALANDVNPSLDSAAVKRNLSGTSAATLGLEIDGVNTADLLIARLRYASVLHSERARQHDYLWGTLLPRLAMVVVGGGLTLAYAWWVIRPIYQQVAAW